MATEAPSELTALLGRLSLATAEQIAEAYPLAQRLASDLPLFQSVWVDALLQSDLLTRFQAAEINAGRGAGLKIGPYVLLRKLDWLGYAESYLARASESTAEVRLLVTHCAERAADVLAELAEVVRRQQAIAGDVLLPIQAVGEDAGRVWLASSAVGVASSRTAADWLIHQGRLSPAALEEVARQMTAAMCLLEKLGLQHGDLSSRTVVVDVAGRVRILWAGVRAVVRPAEGFAHADLPAECYDYLAPARVADGAAADIAGDLFSCGALWWHLAAGREPLAGGNSITKLQAGQSQRIAPLKRFAPEIATPLAQAIELCLHREPQQRSQSFAHLAAKIGSATREGVVAICDYARFDGDNRRQQRGLSTPSAIKSLHKMVPWLATAAAVLVVIGVLSWPLWRGQVAGGNRWALGWSKKDLASKVAPANPNSPDAQTAPTISRDANTSPEQGKAGQTSGERAMQASLQQTLPEDLMIGDASAEDPNRWTLNAGQTVRGASGELAKVYISSGGWQIRVEDAHFENIEFIGLANSAAAGAGAQPSERCLINLRCQHATFENCRFRLEQPRSDAPKPAAIRWHGAKHAGALRVAGRLELANCVFFGVAAGIDWQAAGAMRLDADNCLASDVDRVFVLSHPPGGDELVSLRLNRFTQRGGQALLAVPSVRRGEDPAAISIQATDSVFSAEQPAALIAISGEKAPDRLLNSIAWTGQGSILAGACDVASWHDERGNVMNVSDDLQNVGGLARGVIEFAGSNLREAAASNVIRWTGPLQSSQPPGFRAVAQ